MLFLLPHGSRPCFNWQPWRVRVRAWHTHTHPHTLSLSSSDILMTWNTSGPPQRVHPPSHVFDCRWCTGCVAAHPGAMLKKAACEGGCSRGRALPPCQHPLPAVRCAINSEQVRSALRRGVQIHPRLFWPSLSFPSRHRSMFTPCVPPACRLLQHTGELRAAGREEEARGSRWRGCESAAPPSPFSRTFSRDGEGVPAR